MSERKVDGIRRRDVIEFRKEQYNGHAACSESQSTLTAGHPQPPDLAGKLVVYTDNPPLDLHHAPR